MSVAVVLTNSLTGCRRVYQVFTHQLVHKRRDLRRADANKACDMRDIK
jgi:hypothetical protein